MKHKEDCPIETNNVHECESLLKLLEKHPSNTFVEYNAYIRKWNLIRLLSMTDKVIVFIKFCPFCGDELPILECKCDEIKESLKEQNVYFKTDGNLP